MIAPPSAVHRVITDRLAPKNDIALLRKAGIEVTQVHAVQHASAAARKQPAHKRDQ
jgi:hypothetical protein